MKHIIVAVKGGVAYVVEETVPRGVTVEVVDFDNLEDLNDPTTPKFSATARKYIKDVDEQLAIKLASRPR